MLERNSIAGIDNRCALQHRHMDLCSSRVQRPYKGKSTCVLLRHRLPSAFSSRRALTRRLIEEFSVQTQPAWSSISRMHLYFPLVVSLPVIYGVVAWGFLEYLVTNDAIPYATGFDEGNQCRPRSPNPPDRSIKYPLHGLNQSHYESLSNWFECCTQIM